MKSRNTLDSFNYALQGIVEAVKRERNLKIHLIAEVIVLLLCFIFKVTVIEFIIILIISAMVITAELINTSIEAVIDLVCGDKYNPLAKLAKDVAAGAVLITAMTAAIVGVFIFYDEFDSIVQNKEEVIGLLPTELAVISLGIVFILTILFKIKKGRTSSLFSGGFPSGHSAIAFAAATIVLFLATNTAVILIGYLLAFMVAQSRCEGKIHTVYEVIAGSIFGMLCVIVLYQLFIF